MCPEPDAPLGPDDRQWLNEHRHKIERLMHALARHFGGERLAPETVEWRLMLHKTGFKFMVARYNEYDYWLDPATGQLRYETFDS